MDAELLEALAAEVADQLARQRAEMRREFADELAAVRRAHDAEVQVLRAEREETEHRLTLVQQELAAVRGDPVTALLIDADATLHLVQRSGAHLTVRLPDGVGAARDAVAELGDDLGERLQTEAHAHVARVFELFCNAPRWSPTAVYTAGDIVQTHIGRTFRVRAGVRATMGQDPDEDAERWERLGSGGFRVLKSRPPALTPGDFFTEHDARFLHDGEQTTLFVQKATKTSDVERAVKAPFALAQVAQAAVRALEPQVGEALARVARTEAAANDAAELGAQALAQVEELRSDLAALKGRLGGGGS